MGPTQQNPAESLTKFEGVHMEPMLSLLSSNKYQLQEEQEVLEDGKVAVPLKEHGMKASACYIMVG